MSTLKMFCTRAELAHWVGRLCEQRSLGILVFDESDAPGICIRPPSEVVFPATGHLPSFLYPLPGPETALRYREVRPLEWGWMTLHGGGEQQTESGSVLVYSEIHAPTQLAPHLQWLKRQIKRTLLAGVVGKNDKTGGKATYTDIWHSEAARDLLRIGVVWRQFPNALVSFAPLSGQ